MQLKVTLQKIFQPKYIVEFNRLKSYLRQQKQTPDWNNEFQYKYFITIVRSMGQNILQTAGTTALSTFDRLVYFKSSNAVKQVVDPLGEETIMNALVFKQL